MLQSNTNDGLVAMLLVYSLLALRTPAPDAEPLLGLATAAKFFPVALAPLFAAGTGDRRARPLARFAGAFAAVCLVALYVALPDGGLRELWDNDARLPVLARVAVQPLGPASVAGVAAGDARGRPPSAFCVALAFVPRRRDARQVAALAAAAVIALQLCANYWLFFYVAWFAPLALVAMLGAYRPRLAGPEPSPAPARAARRRGRDRPHAAAAAPGTRAGRARRCSRGAPAGRAPSPSSGPRRAGGRWSSRCSRRRSC